eukprot:TRINITY_DN5735_c0_g1_i1.p1 TRINITY_DN5735_c0_g1~~TRINITY_DN5735_c0_g1_i1.p1  ORF type:complete len:397 (+),score=128.38 TRINITY_DN5735_c0_g1_i1:509-1699(+)
MMGGEDDEMNSSSDMSGEDSMNSSSEGLRITKICQKIETRQRDGELSKRMETSGKKLINVNASSGTKKVGISLPLSKLNGDYTYRKPNGEQIKHGAFSEDEKRFFIEKFNTFYGDRSSNEDGGIELLCWGLFSRHIPGRTGEACRQLFTSLAEKSILPPASSLIFKSIGLESAQEEARQKYTKSQDSDTDNPSDDESEPEEDVDEYKYEEDEDEEEQEEEQESEQESEQENDQEEAQEEAQEQEQEEQQQEQEVYEGDWEVEEILKEYNMGRNFLVRWKESWEPNEVVELWEESVKRIVKKDESNGYSLVKWKDSVVKRDGITKEILDDWETSKMKNVELPPLPPTPAVPSLDSFLRQIAQEDKRRDYSSRRRRSKRKVKDVVYEENTRSKRQKLE